MAYAFISYSHQDAQFVDTLVSRLQNSNVNVWADRYKIAPGSEWQGEIDNALKETGALLFILSHASLNSNWTMQEVKALMTRGVPIFPIVIDEDAIAAIPTYLRNIQWLVLTSTNFEQLVQELVVALPSSVISKTPIESAAPKSKGYAFISFTEVDSNFVSILRAFMESRGYGFWDYQSSDRNYQTQLFLELEDRIREATAVLSVLSPDWKRSKWAPKEYLYAEEVGVPIFLLMARTMGPTLVIAGIPYIDFVSDLEQGFTQLDRELKRKGLE